MIWRDAKRGGVRDSSRTWRRRWSFTSKNLAVNDETPIEWAQLSAPWRTAFELAWEGLLAGSPPVGAVVVDPAGQVIARGRSRRHEATAPAGELAGSRLAHAEVNALAALPVDSTEDIWLLVTLEPCYLCTAAAAISHVSGVWFAGSDPMWRFLEDIATFHPELQRRDYERRGPMPGPIGAWATLLPLIERVRRNPTGTRIDASATVGSELVDYARDLVASHGATQLMVMPLDAAVTSIWPDLVELSNSMP
jgi:tRNA(adenine34) deaminase